MRYSHLLGVMRGWVLQPKYQVALRSVVERLLWNFQERITAEACFFDSAFLPPRQALHQITGGYFHKLCFALQLFDVACAAVGEAAA